MQISKVIAHRGLCLSYPENTSAAFLACVKKGIAAVELDLQLSKDSVPVIFHDNHLQRIANLPFSIAELNFSQLAHIDIGSWYDIRFSDQRIMLYEQFLHLFSQKLSVCAEIKIPCMEPLKNLDRRSKQLIKKVVELSLRYSELEHFAILCFQESVLDYVTQLNPNIYTLLNLSFDKDYSKVPLNRFNGINVEIGRLTIEHKKMAKKHGIELFCYCCDTDAEYQKALTIGCDYFMSNRADWLQKLVK